MRFHVLTLFPEMFAGPFDSGVVGRACKSGLLEVRLRDVRDFTRDRHRSVDDTPFGGGPGMVMKPEPLFDAVSDLRDAEGLSEAAPVLLLTPQGRVFSQSIASELANHAEIVLLCGRYEGVDERVRQHLVTDEISIGDYVLAGGELAAMVVIEAVARLVPGVVGSAESTRTDSFVDGLLEHPHYTRPSEYRGWTVPDVLLSGHHGEVDRWRHRESLRRTFERRPELLERVELSDDDRRYLDTLRSAE